MSRYFWYNRRMIDNKKNKDNSIITDQGLVSIIIPVYNIKPYLREALDSVIRQSYDRLEILVIDDGSTDGSGDICDEYAKKDERIIVIHEGNKGLSAARNKGLEIMTGDYVAFLDADDAYHPDFIKRLIEEMYRSGADISVCKFEYYDSSDDISVKGGAGHINPPIEKGIYDSSEALVALSENRLNHSVWNKLYRRSLWDGIRFPDGHVYEDRYTTYKLLYKANKVSVIDDSLYYYRKDRSGSISNTRSLSNTADWFDAMFGFAAFIEEKTPEVYTEEQKSKFNQALFYELFSEWFICLKSKDPEYKEYGEYLRKRMIRSKSKMGRKIPFSIKVCRHLLYISPKLFILIYPIYRFYKRFSRKRS